MSDQKPFTRAAPARIEELDALRGIMAFMVMLYHLTSGMYANLPSVPVSHVAVPWGQFGVQGFFAISGFVILMTLERTSLSRDFLVSRFSRLFPAYWVSVLITTCVVMIWGPAVMQRSGSEVLMNATMLQSWFGRGDVDPSYWSLGIELGFYGVMLGLWRMRLLERIETIALTLVTLRLAAHLVPPLDNWLGQMTIPFHIPFFIAGILAYRIWSGARTFGQQLPILFLAGLTLYLANMLELTVVFAAATLGITLLIDGRLNWLCSKPLLRLGAISYPLYLIHQYVGCTLMLWLGKWGLQSDLATLLTIGAMVGLASLIHVSVEKPALQSIRTHWKNWKARRQSISQPLTL